MSTSRILSVCCAWLFVLASVSLPALAHQQKEAITRVLFNERTGNIEVMHRVLLHDAEHAMQRRFGTTFDLIGRASDRDAFERYVHGRFSLSDQTGTALTLAPVGSELDHDYLWVYAETAIPDGRPPPRSDPRTSCETSGRRRAISSTSSVMARFAARSLTATCPRSRSISEPRVEGREAELRTSDGERFHVGRLRELRGRGRAQGATAST